MTVLQFPRSLCPAWCDGGHSPFSTDNAGFVLHCRELASCDGFELTLWASVEDDDPRDSRGVLSAESLRPGLNGPAVGVLMDVETVCDPAVLRRWAESLLLAADEVERCLSA